MDPERTKRLQAILKWSLKQEEEEGERIQGPPGPQMDPERQRWLSEALEAFSSQPSETDLLKAALTVLKVHTTRQSVSESEQRTLKEAFEQVKYLIEDLDHANDLIPLQGVDTVIHYLSSDNTLLVAMACELVAVASQNNPPCQRAFLPTMSRLLQLARHTESAEEVKVQAVRAVSSLSRGYDPGLTEFLSQDGLSAVLDCLHSGVQKVIIKSIFMLSSFYANEVNTDAQGLLRAKVGQLLLALAGILSDSTDTEILEHLLSFLSILVHNHLPAVDHQLEAVGKLKDALIKKTSTLSPVKYKEEYKQIQDLIQTLSNYA